MKQLIPLVLVLLMGGCSGSFITRSATGAEFAVTQQRSPGGGAPGVTHYEYRPDDQSAWTYEGTAAGGTWVGEIAGASPAAIYAAFPPEASATATGGDVTVVTPGPPGKRPCLSSAR